MHLVFGLSADGRSYPEFPGVGPGAVGSAVVGPAGLISLLETERGLLGPNVPTIVRIAAWQAKMEVIGQHAFWAKSFAKDSWATARALLFWRDELVMAGWGRHGSKPDHGRLAALAAIEATGASLPRGLCDRIWDVMDALGQGRPTDIIQIDLIEARSSLPTGLSQLIRLLETSGTAIKEIGAVPAAAEGSDLGKVQRYLADGTIDPLVGDGTFIEFQADTGLHAAEAVADWLAADKHEPTAPTVVAVPGGDSALLDHALHGRSLPTLGLSAPSPFRGALQVLPLAFAIAWKPLDPRKLLELLLLPRPPIARFAAARLSAALVDEPGTGGSAWTQAWQWIETQLRKPSESSKDDRKVGDQILRWRKWGSGGLFDPAIGIPSDDAIEICRRVAQWALDADAGRRDPLMLALHAAAGALQAAIETLPQLTLSALLVERMLDQAVAEGARDPRAEACAGPLRGIVHPGALWSPVPHFVWWNFVGPDERPLRSPWSAAELRALAKAGCAPENPTDAGRRIAAAWQRALLNVSNQLILVRPALDAGSETITHPLAHRLNPLLKVSNPAITVRVERILAHKETRLAARNVERQAIAPIAQAEKRSLWILPTSLESRLSERIESATSFEDLIACQMRWIIRHLLRLSPGALASIPEPDRLFGTIAHALAHELFPAGVAPQPDLVRTQATARLMPLVEAIAAPLLQPAVAGELAFARDHIPEALAELARVLTNKQVHVVGTELEREHDFGGGLRVKSRLDMLVQSHAGVDGVIDLKWSRRADRRRTEIKDGRAIQLATYSRLIAPSGGVSAGYFMLSQRVLLAEQSSWLATEPVDASQSLGLTWDALVTTWKSWIATTKTSRMVATGLEGAATEFPNDLPLPPDKEPCRFCDCRKLCRVGSRPL